MIPEDALSDRGMRYVNYGNFFMGGSFLYLMKIFFTDYLALIAALTTFGFIYCYMKAWDEVKMEYYNRSEEVT